MSTRCTNRESRTCRGYAIIRICGAPAGGLSAYHLWPSFDYGNAYWSVLGLVVDVHERSRDTGERFELILQRLADVVRLPQGGLCVHDNINFNEVIRSALRRECKVSCHAFKRPSNVLIRAYVISADSIELLDFWRKGGSFIDNKLNKFVRGGFTRQEAKLLIARSCPSSNDAKRNLDLEVSAINVEATSMLTITPPIGSMTVQKRLRLTLK